jgi:hypothetical protein
VPRASGLYAARVRGPLANVRLAVTAAALVAAACSAPARPAGRPAHPPPPASDPLAWLPADAVAVVRAPATGLPLLAFFASSPRRPACVDSVLAGVREGFAVYHSLAERYVTVAIGAFDRGQLEACALELARVMLDTDVTAHRDGPLTVFGSANGGAQVVAFAADRIALADTAQQLHWILSPPRTVAPGDPLGRLMPRLRDADVAMVTTLDYLVRWTGIPARGIAIRMVRQPALRTDVRAVYAGPAEARRAQGALLRAASRDEVPPAVRRALALVAPATDGAELAFDLTPLFDPRHAALLEQLTRELAALPR